MACDTLLTADCPALPRLAHPDCRHIVPDNALEKLRGQIYKAHYGGSEIVACRMASVGVLNMNRPKWAGLPMDER